MPLAGKKIVLAVTGSIAAYKTPQLVRLLIKAGAQVRVITTKAAEDFVSPLALATVSKNPVMNNVSDGASWNNHVEMGLWADAMLIAPCSANTLAKLANGLCDNLVSAVYLSARCPVFVAPAMDEDMWKHPSTRQNFQTLTSYGHIIAPVNSGELASGLFGEGRMAEPEAIVASLVRHFKNAEKFNGKKVLVTAGPTYEPIDPVRFIGNHSSGKMGIAIAREFLNCGAAVTLVLGPAPGALQLDGLNVMRVQTADEMHDACHQVFEETDIAIMAAAVADYSPVSVAGEKIKKKEESWSVALKKTPDILKSLGQKKKENQVLAGFALETSNERENALSKLQQKNADIIILNSLRDKDAGFGKDTNKVTIFDRKGGEKNFDLKSKTAVAKDIIDYIIEYIHA